MIVPSLILLYGPYLGARDGPQIETGNPVQEGFIFQRVRKRFLPHP